MLCCTEGCTNVTQNVRGLAWHRVVPIASSRPPNCRWMLLAPNDNAVGHQLRLLVPHHLAVFDTKFGTGCAQHRLETTGADTGAG